MLQEIAKVSAKNGKAPRKDAASPTPLESRIVDFARVSYLTASDSRTT
jgi:hypothetical protein